MRGCPEASLKFEKVVKKEEGVEEKMKEVEEKVEEKMEDQFLTKKGDKSIARGI